MAKIALEKYVDGCSKVMQRNVPESAILEHVEDVYKSGNYNDLATRIVYDVARAARYKPFDELFQTDYLTLTDDKLTSLYKKAFKSAFPSVWVDIKARG